MRNDLIMNRRALLVAAGGIPVALALPGVLQAKSLPLVTVTKDPNCGCCDGWAAHIEAAGFPVRVIVSDDVTSLKQRLGVPAQFASCHTAEVDGYVIEGHVPAVALHRLLSERPQAIGLAVPGMPAGSPGMDFPGVEAEDYDAFLFGASGYTTFARFRGSEAI